MTQDVRTVMPARAAALTALGLLAACAGVAPTETPPPAAAPPPVEDGAHKALSVYAADPFEPVNLYLNPNEHVEARHARLLDYAAERIRDSGAFVRVDRGVQRWQSTLQLRCWWEDRPTEEQRRQMRLRRLSFGLVEAQVTRTFHLRAEVVQEPEPVGQLEYAETVVAPVDDSAQAAPAAVERAAVDRLLERMMADIARKKLVPRLREFEAPAPEKKKRKEHRA